LPYRFTAQARDDLRDIAAYTRDRWGDAQCDRYLTSLEWRCLQLAQEPRLRRPYDDDPSYSRALAGKHAIFYRVEADGSLLVVRILHATMLPELHLPGSTADNGEQDE
jgi:toxin ParE1/3/4